MNKLIYSICAGSLAFAVAASAADQDNATPKVRRSNNKVQAAAPGTAVNSNTSARVNANRNVNVNAGTRTNYGPRVRKTEDMSRARQRYYTRESGVNRVNRTNEINRSANVNAPGTNRVYRNGRTVDVNRNVNRNVTVNRSINRTRNVTVVNSWNNARFAGTQYAPFRNYHRQFHDRGWYNNYRVSFFFGAPYYWNAGYWYPAWGYGPGYTYTYDGPIYGYNNLDPQRVVVNVQQQLADEGYYSGPIDGELGPMTRQALADFQADHGLAVTSAVDEPTLSTLGLV